MAATAREIEVMLADLDGEAGLVVASPGGDGPRLIGGTLRTGPAWSTIKVPIAQRVITDAGGPAELAIEDRSLITRAITQSDNAAASVLFQGLGARHGGLAAASVAVGQMLRAAGDTRTRISIRGRDGFSTYGQTQWSLVEQNRYLAALVGGCLTDSPTRDLLLEELAAVTVEPWGLGAIGAPVRLKGGWGPGLDGRYLVRQMGTVEVAPGNALVISAAAISSDGTFDSAQTMLTAVASWTVENLADDLPAAAPC